MLWPPLKFFGVLTSAPYIVTRGLLPAVPFMKAEALHAAFTFAWSTAVLGLCSYVVGAKLGMVLKRYVGF